MYFGAHPLPMNEGLLYSGPSYTHTVHFSIRLLLMAFRLSPVLYYELHRLHTHLQDKLLAVARRVQAAAHPLCLYPHLVPTCLFRWEEWSGQEWALLSLPSSPSLLPPRTPSWGVVYPLPPPFRALECENTNVRSSWGVHDCDSGHSSNKSSCTDRHGQ